MEYSDILCHLAPCGLNCRKCLAYHEGDIRKTSEELQRLLGDFDRYAERFAGFAPVFNNYGAFKELPHNQRCQDDIGTVHHFVSQMLALKPVKLHCHS